MLANSQETLLNVLIDDFLKGHKDLDAIVCRDLNHIKILLDEIRIGYGESHTAV